MIYDKIPNASWPSNTIPLPPSKESHVVDGVIGLVGQQLMRKYSNQTTLKSDLTMTNQSPSSTAPMITYDVIIV